MFKSIKRKINAIIDQKIDNCIDNKLQLAIQMNEFINAPNEILSSFVESKTDIHDVAKEFRNLGIPVVNETINIKNFQNWMLEYSEVVANYKVLPIS